MMQYLFKDFWRIVIWTLIFIVAKTQSIHPDRFSYYVIWNVGYGQWHTLIEDHACTHIDLGGERLRFKASLLKHCQSVVNAVIFTHLDRHHLNLSWFYKKWLSPTCPQFWKEYQRLKALDLEALPEGCQATILNSRRSTSSGRNGSSSSSGVDVSSSSKKRGNGSGKVVNGRAGANNIISNSFSVSGSDGNKALLIKQKFWVAGHVSQWPSLKREAQVIALGHHSKPQAFIKASASVLRDTPMIVTTKAYRKDHHQKAIEKTLAQSLVRRPVYSYKWGHLIFGLK